MAKPVSTDQRIYGYLALREAAGVLNGSRRRLHILDGDSVADRGKNCVNIALGAVAL